MTDTNLGKALRKGAEAKLMNTAENISALTFPEDASANVAVEVPVASVQIVEGPRFSGENSDHIRLMADLETALPPIVLDRESMRLIDGRHRLRAAQLRGDTHITAVFFDGSEADAFVLAVKANTTHGLPLTLGERTAAAHRILLTHPQWSDSAVASCTGLAAKTVSGIRRSSKEIPKLNSRVGRDGRVRPVDASAGRERAAQLIIEQPGASLREVARKAGVSPATVQDVRDRLQRGESALSSRKKRRSQPARVVDREPETLAELIQGLQRDPSIRFSDSGRKLLRLLSSQPLQLEHWETVIADVPTHRNDAVTRIAMQHAANWERFANKLAQRQDEQRRTAG